MIDRFIKYALRVEYQVQGRRFVKDGYIIYRPNEIDVEEFTTAYILPLEAPPQCDQQGFLEYLRTQLDKLYAPDGLLQAEQRGAIAYTENMYSTIKPIRWQDLTEAERLEHLENMETGLYDEAQTVIKRAVNVFRRKQQLDSGAPDPLLVSQTPAQDTATKDAEQPPAVAVVDADAEQTDPAAQTPAASKQARKEPPQQPQAGSGGRKQNYFKLPKGKKGINILLEILQYLRAKRTNKKITQEWIAGQIGFDKSNWNKEGTLKEGTLGDYLCKLKQYAEQYPDKDKTADYLFCAALLKELKEAELDPDKDINWREIPKGTMNDRGQWE